MHKKTAPEGAVYAWEPDCSMHEIVKRSPQLLAKIEGKVHRQQREKTDRLQRVVGDNARSQLASSSHILLMLTSPVNVQLTDA